MKRAFRSLAALAIVLAAGAARAEDPTLKDIEKTLGQVPTFFRALPADALDGAWADMKSLNLNPATALPGKVKELIGLAVAAQVPCKYCIYFHTEVAKLNGASEAELREAVLMASATRRWSTMLNGLQTDDAQFKAEVGKVFDYLKSPHPAGAPIAVVDAASAYKDMQQTLGLVPSFLKAYPAAAIAGAWREFKAVQLNPKSPIPGKYTELIGLAVAAQIPCKYCIYFHTEAARLNGATEEEIREAVAMAASTRHWSTFLNGMQVDEATFRKDTDEIVTRFRKAMAKK